jgi:hypothetical protein
MTCDACYAVAPLLDLIAVLAEEVKTIRKVYRRVSIMKELCAAGTVQLAAVYSL